MSQAMRRVILESPYAGKTHEEIEANTAYARAAVRDCLLRGESAFPSHLLFTQPGITRDNDQSERALGMRAGMAWTSVAEAVVVYQDRGITPGMKSGVTRAEKLNLPIEYRTLPTGKAETSPAELHDLLLTIGHDVDAQALARAAPTEADVRAAVAWAKSQHATAQGQLAAAADCPPWLEEILPPPDTTP